MATRHNEGLVTDFLTYLRTDRHRSKMTVFKYRYSYISYIEHLGQTRLEEATEDDMRAWLRRPRQKQRGPELAPATLKREISELRSLYRWLARTGRVARSIADDLEPPTVHNENPHPAPEDAWRTLWASDLTDSERAAFGLGYFCGLRRAEAVSLLPTNFHGEHLRRFVRKGGARCDLTWVSCVNLYAEQRPDLIGGDPKTFFDPVGRLVEKAADDQPILDWTRWRGRNVIDPFHFNRQLKLALKRAGLEGDLFTPHSLRHSFCSNMLDMTNGDLIAVQRLANHSNVTTTQRYIRISEDPLARHHKASRISTVRSSGVPALAPPWA